MLRMLGGDIGEVGVRMRHGRLDNQVGGCIPKLLRQTRHGRRVADVAAGHIDPYAGGADVTQSRGDGICLPRPADQGDPPRSAVREVIAELQAEVSGPAENQDMVGHGIRFVDIGVAAHDPLDVKGAVAQRQLRFLSAVQCRDDLSSRIWQRSTGEIKVPEPHARVLGAHTAEAGTGSGVYQVKLDISGNYRLSARGDQPALGQLVAGPEPPPGVGEKRRDFGRRRGAAQLWCRR